MNKKVWAGIFGLIAIEQVIKIIIYKNFFDRRFPILPPVLYFEPMFNKQYSWFNSLFQLGIGRGVHIVFSLIVTALIYLFYSYLSNRAEVAKLVNVMFVFLFSGAVCSLIDKIFWDGSLDYISVKGLFTFDLKDVYLNIFNGLLIFSVFFHNKALRHFDDEEILKGFIRYVLRKP